MIDFDAFIELIKKAVGLKLVDTPYNMITCLILMSVQTTIFLLP